MLNLNLVRKTFKKTKGIYLSLLALTIVFMSVSFMSVKMLNTGREIDPETWINTYKTLYFGTFGLMIVGVLAALLPIMVLTKEIDDSSLTIFLVSNFSRKKVLLNKFITLWLMMFMYTIFQTIIVGVGFNILCGTEYAEKMINTVWTYFCGGTMLMAINYLVCAGVQSKKNVFLIIGIISVISVLLPMMYALTNLDILEFGNYVTLFIFSNPKIIERNDWTSIFPYLAYLILLPSTLYITTIVFENRRLYL